MGVCFDVGHAHLTSSVPLAFEVLKDRIRSTHVHDNKEDRDSHLWPGDGNINWKQTMELLRTAPQQPPLLLEIEGVGGENVSEKMTAAFGKLEGAPRPLMPDLCAMQDAVDFNDLRTNPVYGQERQAGNISSRVFSLRPGRPRYGNCVSELMPS